MKININDLEKELKSGKLRNLYLFYGEELYLIESTLKKIRKIFGEAIKGINYIILDESNIDSFISNIETPAFGYEKKLIIVKNAGLTKKEGKGKGKKNNSGLSDTIANYIKDNIKVIEQGVIIIFIEETIEKNTLFVEIEKLGIICEFQRLTITQLTKRLKAICNAYMVNVEEDTLNYLVEIAGTDMQDLINEIRKLIEYVGKEGIITKKLIDSLTTKQIQAVIFDLTDNLGSKNITTAMEVLRGLIQNKEPLQKILITLYNHFKKLYLVRLTLKNNKDIAKSLNLKPNQMFLINKYKKQANYFKEEDLRNILEELMNLDYSYKTGSIDLNIGLETILCKYCEQKI